MNDRSRGTVSDKNTLKLNGTLISDQNTKGLGGILPERGIIPELTLSANGSVINPSSRWPGQMRSGSDLQHDTRSAFCPT